MIKKGQFLEENVIFFNKKWCVLKILPCVEKRWAIWGAIYSKTIYENKKRNQMSHLRIESKNMKKKCFR